MPDDLQPVYIEVRRPGHTNRWHAGAVAQGTTLTPEACNLDSATVIEETATPPAPDMPLARLCKRCFRDRHREAMA